MDMTPEEYAKLVREQAPASPAGKNLLWAFCTGGGICVLGQLLRNFYENWGLGEDQVSLGVSVTLIGIAVLLTALGVFDKLARYAGAGTLVPITGFANAMASPAVEFRTEGLITGMGAKMFIIAGPVLAWGITASVVYGLVYWIASR